MKSKFQQLLEETLEQIKSSNHSENELNSFSDEELLKVYKDAFDKQFTGGGKEDTNKYYSEIKKRGGKVLIQANNYADYKRNLER